MTRWHAFLFFVTVLVVGCGAENVDQSVPVSGRVTKGGQPLEVSGREVGAGMVQIGFWEIAADGKQSTQPWEAVVAADGRFSLFGRAGHGLPPGKYRISVRQWDPFPGTDKLSGEFDEQNSPIYREIRGPAELEIDLDAP